MRVGNIVGMHGRLVFTRPIEDEDCASVRKCPDCGAPAEVLVIETAPGDIYPAPNVEKSEYHTILCWGWCGVCAIG